MFLHFLHLFLCKNVLTLGIWAKYVNKMSLKITTDITSTSFATWEMNPLKKLYLKKFKLSALHYGIEYPVCSVLLAPVVVGHLGILFMWKISIF